MLFEPSSNQWFAVQVISRKERLAATVLVSKGYEVFLPMGRRNALPSKAASSPLFPGYLFCRHGVDVVGPLLTTPGVLRIVGIGNRPAPVDNTQIQDIRRIHDSGTVAERCPFSEIGQRVVIVQGPLAGIEGVLVSYNDSDWLVVSILLLQRSIRVRLHGNSVSTLA
ncbi:MAG: hypothetical protein LAP87_08270 [Acidobacteriia bacterium]|nr:hypothetical protein [Terriglobia bacterium]